MPGSKLPSVRWLMRHFAVSLQTVSAAIERLALEGLIVRKQGSGLYVSPRPSRRAVVFVRTNHPSANFDLIETGLRHACRMRQWALQVCRKEKDEDGIWIPSHLKPDVIIVMSDLVMSDLGALRRLYPEPLPIVVVGTSGTAPETDFVTTDDARGIEMLLEHLVGLGHRRIAFLNNEPPFPEVLERIRTFQTLSRERFGLEQAAVIDCHLAPWGDVAVTAYDAIQKHPRAKLRELCSAIIVCSFPGAVAAIRALQDHGLNVPGEMSVASLNEEKYAEFFKPRPTTLWWNLESVGEECLRVAENRLSGAVARCLGTRVQPILHDRESSGRLMKA